MEPAPFTSSVWREYPDAASEKAEKVVSEENPRIATKNDCNSSAVVGNIPLPLNTVTSWSIKMLKVSNKSDFLVGVAPFDIDQNEYDRCKCGWRFSCRSSLLYSGPPHKCMGKNYGPDKKETKHGKYIKKNGVVGVVIDTNVGKLSFVLDGKDCGPAYERIPLDKPLVPCVLLECTEDAVEFIANGLK